MRILLTGSTGYIGKRLLPVLLEQGHYVICAVRDRGRVNVKDYKSEHIELVECDFANGDTLKALPTDIDAAYYLIHSMNESDFENTEEISAQNFVKYLDTTTARQAIYLGGILNSANLSAHLASRKKVEEIISAGRVPVTALRAGIIVGSGSASFEIIRDLVEKLPVMVAPRWLDTKCQPIAIRNVIQLLSGVLDDKRTFGRHFDIYGPDTLTYKEMLLQFAAMRGFKRKIIPVPVMTPRLSSYWLYFVTSTSYKLAKNLVDSMKVDVIAVPNELMQWLKVEPISYRDAIKLAFGKIEQNLVLSSWNDAGGSIFRKGLSAYIEVPKFGVFTDTKTAKAADPKTAEERIFAIGGSSGWYYANWLWSFRGWLDRLFGGVGLRRGRKNLHDLSAGDALDFWRVVIADRQARRLVLYAEMKLPGEAWLEFSMDDTNCVHQKATFRPDGISGRLYWYAVLPFHFFIFKGMIDKIVAVKEGGVVGGGSSEDA